MDRCVNIGVNNINFDNLDLDLIIQDFKNVRNATIYLIGTLTKKQLCLVGHAGKHEVALEEYLKSIIEQEIHHINLIKKKKINQDMKRQ